MMLTEQQFDKVQSLLEDSGIKNDELKHDLLDHIACSIEERMNNGISFEEATGLAFHTFTYNHIKKLEYTTETITKESMKKHTKIIGLIGFFLTLIGAIMKILHLPGAAIILGLGVIVLGFGFFVSNAIDTIAKLDSIKGKFVQITGAVGAIFTLAGGMFKLLHLPGAGQLIILGPILLLVYFSFSSMIRTKVLD